MDEKKIKMHLPKIDDLFTTQEERDNINNEKVIELDINNIDDFPNHPFKVVNNEEMEQMKESIKDNGVLVPALVRQKEDGRYEMISGHRRKFASKLAGLEKIPCIVRDLTDDEAIIIMVDSNMQREKILPSEKAFAYKMKYEALQHQRKSTVNQTGTEMRPLGTVVRSDNLLADELGESARQIQRYIRLTNLIPELLKMVDNAELKESPSIALRPAVELSFLNKNEQKLLAKYIEFNLVTPSLEQAIKLKELSRGGILIEENINNLLDIPKANQIQKFKINEDKLYSVVPKNIDRDKLEDFIIKACEFYSKHLKQRDRER